MHRPRWISDASKRWLDASGHPIQISEVTIRTTMGQLLLTPTAHNQRLIMGVFGRALTHFPVELYAVATMGNHLSYLAGFRDAATQADFMQFVHGNIAKELGKYGDYSTARPGFSWRGGFWGRRGRPIAVLTEAAAVQRLKYLLSNGTKEGLARSPRSMGGAHSGRALCTTERTMYGAWIDRSQLSACRRRLDGRNTPERDVTTVHEIRLAKLPHLRHLDDAAYRDICARLCDEIEAEAREKFGPGFTPLGLTRRRRVDPTKTVELDRSPAPLVHCSDPDLRKAYRAAYDAFVEAYQLAHHQLKHSLETSPPFPPGGIPPGTRIRG